ncbi:hypothetical protein ONZ45_g7537 [Pleurotus djamor]|nr:hypothetical protein ONZ45_g7537 [Pleurotus djamor]
MKCRSVCDNEPQEPITPTVSPSAASKMTQRNRDKAPQKSTPEKSTDEILAAALTLLSLDAGKARALADVLASFAQVTDSNAAASSSTTATLVDNDDDDTVSVSSDEDDDTQAPPAPAGSALPLSPLPLHQPPVVATPVVHVAPAPVAVAGAATLVPVGNVPAPPAPLLAPWTLPVGYNFPVPSPGEAGPFYIVSRGLNAGVFARWDQTAPLVIGVRGAVYHGVPSIGRGIEVLQVAIARGDAALLP